MKKLDISLKRVQTFIFEVPRLKSMLGANALIGQVMRRELTELLGDTGKPLEWPAGLELSTVDDPLAGLKGMDRDDPKALFKRGILARDGGRFIAVFNSEEAATAFEHKARRLLARRLPGVLADISGSAASLSAREQQLVDLPVLQVCEATGSGPAAVAVATVSRGKASTRYHSASVKRREQSGLEFYAGKTADVVGLMRNTLYPEGRDNPPKDLSDIASNGYIALIHADGNRIGARYNAWREASEAGASDDTAKEARGELFFHGMRVAVRRALVNALEVFDGKVGTSGTRGYEVLMLGGDDLLLVCRADMALDFAVRYAEELKLKCCEMMDNNGPLDVAIGVAIAKETYPFHRLHELAEELAGSAKRLFRANPKVGSVIDWQVVTQSWFGGVAQARQASERVEYEVNGQVETLLLSGRPYPALGDDGLQGLCAKARDGCSVAAGDEDGAARSPLRALRQSCSMGRIHAQLAFESLPAAQRQALGWHKGEDKGKLWAPRGAGKHQVHLTRALDIVDIAEIGRLGRQRT